MLVFNRPHLTQKVFEEVRKAQPSKLYVSADGPRSGNSTDVVLTQQTRAIFNQIDWPCELHTRFLDNNLGCRLGVSSGITWFFEQEERGIVLEDDVLPIPAFFDFCDLMLDRYEQDEKVMSISGCNLVRPWYQMNGEYAFSRYMCVWGWASWRRAWHAYDEKIANWPVQRVNPKSEFMNLKGLGRLFWRLVYDLVYTGKIGTWDHQWVYAHWINDALTVIPRESLVVNLGFGKDATHTSSRPPEYVNRMRALPFNCTESISRLPVVEDTILSKSIAEKAIRVNWLTYSKLLIRRFDILFRAAKKLQVMVNGR